jgi:hypothetical protein
VKGTVRAGISIAALASALLAAPANAALLDASCPGPPSGGAASFGVDSRRAQVFTAIHTGSVVRAQTEISKSQSGNDFQLQILATNGSGVPVNGILGAATIADASVPMGPSTLSGTFQTPASVVSGQQYALVLTRPGDDGFVLRDRSGDPCPGREFASNNSTGAWNPDDQTYDFVYQVFVNPPNDFTVGKLKKRTLSLTVPGPGAISVANAGGGGKQAVAAAKKKLLKTSTATAAAAGTPKVKLKLTKLAKSLLADNGKVKAKAAITFTPTGGEPKTITQKLKIK